MKQDRFDLFMHAVDDDLLCEAQEPLPQRKQHRAWFTVVAACLCIFAISCTMFRYGAVQQNRVEQQLADHGYVIPVPDDAQNVTFSYSDLDGLFSVPVAQASYEYNGVDYLCRALKDEEGVDLADADSTILRWSSNDMTLSLMDNGNGTRCIAWYDSSSGTQWCLIANEDTTQLLTAARGIMLSLGYDMAVAPEGASDISYQVYEQGGLVIAETSFTYEGKRCAFRMASTSEIQKDFADISDQERAWSKTGTGSVRWCPARFSYNENGDGKIVWFDVVPGLLYSLYVDSDASEESLLTLAEAVFHPAQEDS